MNMKMTMSTFINQKSCNIKKIKIRWSKKKEKKTVSITISIDLYHREK